MVHNSRGYWVFGLCLLSGFIMDTKEHDVSETRSVSVQCFLLAISNGTNRASGSHSLIRGRKQIRFRNIVVFGMPDDGQSPNPSSPERLFLIYKYFDAFKKNIGVFCGENLAYVCWFIILSGLKTKQWPR
jgi:hypothetical protein